ncbi:MAG TPA: prepilin-type N-terminal cleavage/methylation domain-containing protein [Xanthomonadaceae bacterium]|nr:prepilin-type N-terminal cleavage/methylation domain-containing protein [Xanthomonadaceae bacterium]
MKARGFTLIEVLLATVLLAAGLALAFTTLRAAATIAQRGEATAQRNERMRAVAGFLRARLVAAKPQPFAIDQDTGLPLRFVGQADRMRFVADLPDYLGHGGPYVHELYVADGADRDTVDLMLSLAVQQPLDVGTAADPEPPEPLARGLQAVRFRYRALDAEGRPGEWREEWRASERLPLQVEITIRDAEGRDWPRQVVALPLAGTITSAFGEGL